MAFSDGNGMSPADVAAVTGGNGFGFGGDGAWWLIVLFLFALSGRGFGFGGGNGDGYQQGFDQAALMNGINSITAALNNGQMMLMQTMNTNQMAVVQGMNTLSMGLQNYCCENREALSNALNQILTHVDAKVQSIHDKLCQLELDGIKQNYENRIAGMQNALDQARSDNQALRFAAAEGTQTSRILADNAAQTVTLEQYLAPTARPAYLVPNPNCCPNQSGYYGCGGVA